MKTISLTSDKAAIVDDEDYEKLIKYKWYIKKSNELTCYAIRFEKRKSILMHREILSVEKGMLVDHKDHNGLNNQKSNIRICTVKQNAYNRNVLIKNSTGFKGVCYEKWSKKYQACLWDGKKRYKKRFDNVIEAAKWYDELAKKIFGEFAKLNLS